MPFKLTLDTNSIINLLDDESLTRTSVDDLKYILSLADEGLVTAFITTRFTADQFNDANKARVAKIASRLQELPIETVGVGFRLDVSTLDGDDFLGDDEIIAIKNELTQLLSPNGLNSSDKSYSNRINDIDHLIGHYQSGNDVFITDDGGILNKAEGLRNLLGITVMSPSDFATYARNQIQEALKEGLTTTGNEYFSRPSQGIVEFDYSNNNGRYTIGQGLYAFETVWSKASNTSIHAYSDGSNVDTIALVKNSDSISGVADAKLFDYSSRSRTVRTGEVLLLRNKSGAYAALQVTNIQDDSRGDSRDLVAFNYKVLPMGSSHFT